MYRGIPQLFKDSSDKYYDCSETLCQLIGAEWKQIQKPIYAYYFGDHDPKGFTIERSFRKRKAHHHK